MSRVLIAYCTNAGSTTEVASAVAEELVKGGQTVELCNCRETVNLSAFDSVVIGAPMIFGWHGDALRFVRQHRSALAGKKTAFFACAMRLTVPSGQVSAVVPLSIDPNLAEEPTKPYSLTLQERFTTLQHYLKPMLAAGSAIQPVSVALFKGNLEMVRLKWWQAAFVMIAVQAPPGDYRDWDFIRKWAASLAIAL